MTTRATVLRQKLGLLRFLELEDLYLMEVQYPENAFQNVPLVPPTFLDGSTFVVYRSKEGTGNWGVAVDLSSPSYPDGFPEGVHRQVPFTEDFTVQRVGVMQAVWHQPNPVTLHSKTPDPLEA